MNVCLLFVDLKYWKKCDNLTFINQEWLFYVQESQKEITLGLFVLWGIPCASFQWFARSKHLRLSAKSFFYVWPSPLWIKLWGCKLIYQSFKYFSISRGTCVSTFSFMVVLQNKFWFAMRHAIMPNMFRSIEHDSVKDCPSLYVFSCFQKTRRDKNQIFRTQITGRPWMALSLVL